MKLPRVLLVTTMAMGCSSTPGGQDGGSDAGVDGGDACPLNSACDAGAGLPAGTCILATDLDGGQMERCEPLV
jgi:hypothetical protein